MAYVTRTFSVGLVAIFATALGGCSCHGLAGLELTGDGSGLPGEQVRLPSGPVVPGKAQLRLLNATEYRNTVRDLLSLDASQSLPMADSSGGYDTGADGEVDDNTLSFLVIEAERLASAFVASGLRAAHPCFDPSNVTDACISEIISSLGARAYRRPLSAEMAQTLLTFFQQAATSTESRVTATELLVARMLSSPYFLYRAEIGTASGSTRLLDPFERASLLSYSVTGSMPDAALMADAAAGVLEGEVLRSHVRRLLATPAAEKRVVSFFAQWLRVQPLDQMVENPAAFPKLASPEQAVALRDEFAAYVGSVVFRGAGTLPALFRENHTFVNRHSAPLYGLSSDSDALGQVWLDPSQRRGVLTLASVMAAHGSVGDPTKDRPVRRGLLLLNRVMCREVGPPSGINTATATSNVAASNPNFDSLTIREQFEAMMEQGSECKSCHRQFMPLGFAFGNYDALGRHVTRRLDRPIDAAVSDVPVNGQVKAFSGALALVDELASSEATADCFARNYVNFTVGAASGAHVESLSGELTAQFADKHYDITALIEDTLSAPHLYVRKAE